MMADLSWPLRFARRSSNRLRQRALLRARDERGPCSRMGLIQGVTSQLTWNGRERARFSSQSSREFAPALTTAVRGMKIRLEGSVRPRAYGRADPGQGAFMGERGW